MPYSLSSPPSPARVLRWLAPLLAAAATPFAQPAAAFVPVEPTADASRWQTTVTDGSTGSAGDPITLTWSLVPDGTAVRRPDDTSMTKPSDLIADFDAAFGAGPGGADLTQRPWFTYFDQAFARWSELSGVTYVYEPNDNGLQHGLGVGLAGVRGDVRIGGIGMDGVGGTLAYDYFPADGGDMALDTDDLADILGDSTDNYLGLRNTIMHEAGHGLGLDHSSSGNANFLLEAAINTTFDGPQHDDLRGIHWLYGDALEKAGRNETALTASALGTLAAGGTLAVGTGGDGTEVAPGETDFVSIANQDDSDYFSFTVNAEVGLSLSMTPRGASYTQGATPFNTTETSDLLLALFDSDGTSLLAESSGGAAGVVEEISTLLAAGTYYARVEGAGAVVQFYQLDLAAYGVPELLGDFNTDGLVDAADYTTWRDTEGLTLTPYSGADHDGSGVVDAADYALWQTHFGESLGGAIAVPEPAAAALVLFAATAITRRRR